MRGSETNQYLLMAPGPVQVHPQVLKILSEPAKHHRTPEFEHILSLVFKLLPPLFQTKHPVMLQAATGTGGMESCVVNFFSAKDQVLCVVAGKFGERWADICDRYHLEVVRYEIPWGEPADPKKIEDLLTANPKIKGVLIQACETSTGTVHPIQAIAEIVKKKPDVLMIVDAITAMGVMPVQMDQWGLDVVLAASQKALMLPAGLVLIGCSPKAWTANQKARLPRYYWDLKPELQLNAKNQTHFSSPVPLIKGLLFVLQYFAEQSLNKIHQRSRDYSHRLTSAALDLGFSIFSKSPSTSVVALSVPTDLNGEKLIQHLEDQHQITIAGGQDHLKGKIIRFGTMGYLIDSDIDRAIKALQETVFFLQGPRS